MWDNLSTLGKGAIVMSLTALMIGISMMLMSMVTRPLNDAVMDMNWLADHGTVAEIYAIKNYSSSLPASSVYAACKKNEELISSINGTVNGVPIYSLNDLKKVLGYKVNVVIDENSDGNFYIKIGGSGDR